MHLATSSFRENLSVSTILTLRVLKRRTPIFYSFSFARSSSNDKKMLCFVMLILPVETLLRRFTKKKIFMKKNQRK